MAEGKKEINDIFGQTFNDSKVGIINGKNYITHLKNLNKFKSLDEFLQYEKEKYDKQKEDFYKGEMSAKGRQKNFRKYLELILEDEAVKAKNLSIISGETLKSEEGNKISEQIIKDTVIKYFKKDKKIEKFDKIFSLISKIKYLYKFSIYLSNSYYEKFAEDLKNFIFLGEKIKNKFLIDDLYSVIRRLNMFFFQPFKGKKPTLSKNPESKPIFEEKCSEFEKEIDDLLDNMEDDLTNKEENNITKSLEKCLVNLKATLNEEKKNINNNGDKKEEETNKGFSITQIASKIASHIISEIKWTFSNEWRETQDKFMIAFETEASNLKNKFKKVEKNYSKKVDEYYQKIKKLYEEKFDLFSEYFDKEDMEELKKNLKDFHYIKFQTYLKESIDKFNDKNLESVLDDIIKEILQGAKECTDYNNSKSVFDYIKLKTTNSEFLYRIIDYIIENSTKRFNKFIQDIEEISNEYLDDIINNFKLLKKNFIRFFKRLIIHEKISIIEENKKKKAKYLNDVEIYNKENEEWEKTCNDYRIIRDEFLKYINEILNDSKIDNKFPGIASNYINEESNEKEKNLSLNKYITEHKYVTNSIEIGSHDPYVCRPAYIQNRIDNKPSAPIITKPVVTGRTRITNNSNFHQIGNAYQKNAIQPNISTNTTDPKKLDVTERTKVEPEINTNFYRYRRGFVAQNVNVKPKMIENVNLSRPIYDSNSLNNNNNEIIDNSNLPKKRDRENNAQIRFTRKVFIPNKRTNFQSEEVEPEVYNNSIESPSNNFAQDRNGSEPQFGQYEHSRYQFRKKKNFYY